MIKLFRKYWQPSAKWALKASLALRAMIGAIATAAYTYNATVAFWCLVAGAALDFILQCTGKDDEPPRAGQIAGVVLVAATALLMTGCRTVKLERTHERTDSTWVTQKLLTLPVPGGTTKALNMDSLRAVLGGAAAGSCPLNPPPAGQVGKVYTVKDTSGRAELRYWMNAAGQIEAECAAKDTTLQELINENNRLVRDKQTEVKTVTKTPAWAWLLLSALALSFISFFAFILFKIIRK